MKAEEEHDPYSLTSEAELEERGREHSRPLTRSKRGAAPRSCRAREPTRASRRRKSTLRAVGGDGRFYAVTGYRCICDEIADLRCFESTVFM